MCAGPGCAARTDACAAFAMDVCARWALGCNQGVAVVCGVGAWLPVVADASAGVGNSICMQSVSNQLICLCVYIYFIISSASSGSIGHLCPTQEGPRQEVRAE